MKTTIEIDDRLWKLFSMIVLRERGGRKRGKVIEELIKRYVEARKSLLDPKLMEALDSLEMEREAFRKMMPRLGRYRGKYVALKNGTIIAVGNSKEEAALKAYEKVGYSVIYVGYVGEERVVKLPSPRVIR